MANGGRCSLLPVQPISHYFTPNDGAIHISLASQGSLALTAALFESMVVPPRAGRVTSRRCAVGLPSKKRHKPHWTSASSVGQR